MEVFGIESPIPKVDGFGMEVGLVGIFLLLF